MKIKPELNYHIFVYQIKDYDGYGVGIFQGHTKKDVDNDSVMFLSDSRNILLKEISKYSKQYNKEECNELIQKHLIDQDR